MTLATKKLHAAAQIAHLDANDILDKYLDTFKFPSEESRKLSKVALLNYTAAAILMPYKLFYKECKEQRYDLRTFTKYFCYFF